MNFWIGVASKEHVRVGQDGGFSQLCHGKEKALRRMKKDDWILYYSPKIKMQDKVPYQKFTAIGKIINNEIYNFEMAPNFVPFRKDVNFISSVDVDIRPLISTLSFIADKKRWGYPFRYGHIKIVREDFLLIASNMLDEDTFKQMQEEIEYDR